MPNYMKLTDYQETILAEIVTSYTEGKPSIWIEMPVGSGKTMIAMNAIKRILHEDKLKKVAIVASHKVLKSYFQDMISNQDLESNTQSFTYQELEKLITERKILKDDFDIILFDEAELGSNSLEIIYIFFTAFKIGFARPGVVYNSFLSGPTVKFNYQNLLASENVFTLYNHISTNSIDLIETAIQNIEVGSNWNDTIKNSLIEKVEFFQREQQSEYKEILKVIKSGKIDLNAISEISYRKEELEEFGKLLSDSEYFREKSNEASGDESVWQKFFEKNQWIFGFSLNYIFNSPLDGRKLENTVVGHSVVGAGKRSDALLKTNGIIQSLCFGEIKTHKKEILKNTTSPYRSESWAISDELAGGIAQIQRTVQKSLYNIQQALETRNEEGYINKERLYLYKPKAFLLIGCLQEFKNDDGLIHEDKYSSFEIFRRSINDIEIITFDELYERANAIVNKRWKE